VVFREEFRKKQEMRGRIPGKSIKGSDKQEVKSTNKTDITNVSKALELRRSNLQTLFGSEKYSFAFGTLVLIFLISTVAAFVLIVGLIIP
jgi:hypothetical protein